MSAFDTPNWAQRVLKTLIVLGLLGIGAVVAFADSPREPVSMRCAYAWRDTQIKCEAVHVEPFSVVWEVIYMGEVVHRNYNSVTYLTMSQESPREVRLYVVSDGQKQLQCSVLITLVGHKLRATVLEGERR